MNWPFAGTPRKEAGSNVQTVTVSWVAALVTQLLAMKIEEPADLIRAGLLGNSENGLIATEKCKALMCVARVAGVSQEGRSAPEWERDQVARGLGFATFDQANTMVQAMRQEQEEK